MLRTAHITKKPWGHEELWATSHRYIGKILFIKKGHRLSRQYHKVKEETVMVLEGELTCEHGPYFEGDTVYTETMQPGEIFHVFPGTIHRFGAEMGDVKLVEVSTPELQDLTRLEDDYRRITDIPVPPPTSGK
jgi:mannose-6-phosphate isomerase-like protein (cupin superfamily)